MKARDHSEPPIRMDGVSYSQLMLRRPFCVRAPLTDEWLLYVVRDGGILFHAPAHGGEIGPLAPGTVIGMSGNDAHMFTSTKIESGESLSAAWQEVALGTAHACNQAIIALGRIPQSSMPFLTMMGGYIRIDPAEHQDTAERVSALLDWISAETQREDAASGEIILRLAEIITIEIGRIGRARNMLFSHRPPDAQYDARIWRAIVAISNEPEAHWTVESMAQIAGMSRSAFAARYQETVGQTPLRSLRRLRMHRAAIQLASPARQVIAALAATTGYASDAAFNRAFVKEFGYPPKRYSQSFAAHNGQEV